MYLTDIQKAIDYIEENLEEDINYEKVAKKIEMSSYYFHRIFSSVIGISPTEYIRNRRLTKAAEELINSDCNILDIAIKYQFGSNESFTRAFTKFHGIVPKLAKTNGSNLKSYSKVKLEIKVNGGNILNYRIEDKDNFKICLTTRDFSIETKEEIPKFWEEIKQNGMIKEISRNYTENVVGVCIGEPDSKYYKYGIGRIIGNNDKGFSNSEIINIEKSKWIVFKCKGQNATDINNLWSRIYKEYFISSEYSQSMNIDFELYDDKDTEIWIPVSK